MKPFSVHNEKLRHNHTDNPSKVGASFGNCVEARDSASVSIVQKAKENDAQVQIRIGAPNPEICTYHEDGPASW